MTGYLNIVRPGDFTSVNRTVRTFEDGMVVDRSYRGGVLVRTQRWEQQA